MIEKRLAVFLTLVFLLILMVGCYTRRLTKEIANARVAIQAAREARAQEYTPGELKKAQYLLKEAQTSEDREYARKAALESRAVADFAASLSRKRAAQIVPRPPTRPSPPPSLPPRTREVPREPERGVENIVELYYFYGRGCLHCAQIESMLMDLKKKYPQLQIRKFEIYFNKENRELFSKLTKAYGTTVTAQNIPVIFIDQKVFSGREGIKAPTLEKEIERCLREGAISPLEKLRRSGK